MYQYCSYRYHDGWTQLLEYDEVYQTVIGGESESTYGFHESWDELQDEVDFGAAYWPPLAPKVVPRTHNVLVCERDAERLVNAGILPWDFRPNATLRF